jgi:hypothetical protein
MNYGYIKMAILFVKLNQYDKAVRSFVKSKENILSVFTILREHKTIDEIKQIASFFIPLLAEDVFFNSIIKPVKENIEPYRKFYINSMLIISLLYVDFKGGEEFVATYTNEDVVNALLLKDSPLRLSLSIQSNDLLEGQCLLDYLYPKKDLFTAQRVNLEDKENFGSFITCFTFNQDHLNHFRLYGNKNNIQASGISLIFDKYLFANNHISIDTYTVEYSGQSKNTESTHKLPLFRCIYLDPSTGFIASVGHREEQTFYESKKDMEKVEEYKKKIEDILAEVRTQLTQMKKDVNILDSRIVGQLLLPLRYLIKHIDFKEEQECRIFSVKAKCESKKEEERNYFDYFKIKHHIKGIILGAKCLEDKNAKKQFMDDIKKTGITNIKRSKCPFV